MARKPRYLNPKVKSQKARRRILDAVSKMTYGRIVWVDGDGTGIRQPKYFSDYELIPVPDPFVINRAMSQTIKGLAAMYKRNK